MKRYILGIILAVTLVLSYISPFTSTGAQASNIIIEPNPYLGHYAPGDKINELSTETSTTVWRGGARYTTDVSLAPINYKDNYSDPNEAWKPVDLTIVNGHMDKAPYILDIDTATKTVRIQDKKTGAVTTIGMESVGITDVSSKGTAVTSGSTVTWSNISTDVDIKIMAENSAVRFQRIIKSSKASTKAAFTIDQSGADSIKVLYKAQDMQSRLGAGVPLTTSLKDGILTEDIDTTKSGAITYPLTIDPTLDVQLTASARDGEYNVGTGAWGNSYNNLTIGRDSADTSRLFDSYVRFTNITGIASTATISTSYVTFRASAEAGQTGTTFYYKIYAEASDNATEVTSGANYAAKTWTTGTAQQTYAAWTANNDYQMASANTPIQEVINRSGWSSVSSSILLTFKNDSSSANAARKPYSYDGSATYCAKLHIEYTNPAPSVTTIAASSITTTTAKVSGNITALNGFNVNKIGAQYGTNSTTYGSWDNVTISITSAPYAWTDNLTSLAPGTKYYHRAFADNTTTSFGSQLNFTTLLDTPTNVNATDGTDTAQVVVTWTKVTGATGYIVYRDDTNASGTLGDVATYNDTGAAAPTITAGTASAADNVSSAYVTLSIAGESTSVGASYNYKVKAVTTDAASDNSTANSGYRGVGALTYQWYVSAADSDASFSTISGGTTDPYNYTGAPAYPTGRYYYCHLTATGASAVDTNHDRGFLSSFVAATIATGACTGFTSSQAVLNGTVTSIGDAAITIYGFDYGLTASYGSSVTRTASVAGGASFWIAPTDLLPATKYHFRAKAFNGAWGYGTDGTFSTVGSPVLYETLSTGYDSDSDNITGNTWGYMQFTAGTLSHTATSLQVYIKRVGTPGTCTIALYHASGGTPTGNVLATTTFNGDAISTSYNSYSFNITETAIQASQQYAIVLIADNGTASSYLKWGIDAGGSLANAVYGTSADGGLTYTAGTPKDALFSIWGNAALSVEGAHVFTGYREDNDWLIVADTRNFYSPYYPDYDPSTLFQLQLINGSTVVASAQAKAWQRQPLAIYLNSTTAGSLTWGGTYKLRLALIGSTTVIGEYSLVTADWQSGSMAYLDSYVRNLASVYQAYYTTLTGATVTYLVSGVSGDSLNADGAVIFQRGIANIASVRPSLFLYVSPSITIPSAETSTGTGSSRIIMSDRLGPKLYGMLDGLAQGMGMPDAPSLAGGILIALWLLTAVICLGIGGGFGIGGGLIGGSFWLLIGIFIIGGAFFTTMAVISFIAGVIIIWGFTARLF
jgi:hypothetical protein